MSYKLALDEVEEAFLHDINMDMKYGDFLAVVGKVGCGKTSLLYSILEEMRILKGERIVKGSIAYVE